MKNTGFTFTKTAYFHHTLTKFKNMAKKNKKKPQQPQGKTRPTVVVSKRVPVELSLQAKKLLSELADESKVLKPKKK